jgi:intein-encoded DNA endonuclease-like protein
MDEALADLGGVRTIVEGMDAKGVPYRRMADRLEQMTGVRVSPNTVRNWVLAWFDGAGTQDNAAG